MTPCIKAHGSDGAFDSIRLALQCYGGAGYCEEYPVAQMLRDSKVFSIYEGTNGIQAMDLLGRKVPMKNGAAVRAIMTEIGKTLDEARKHDTLTDIAQKLQEAQNEVVGATMHLGALGMAGEIHQYISNASAYLEMFSQLLMAWQLLEQATVAQKALDNGAKDHDFYQAKIQTAQFYANTVLPQTTTTAQTLKSNDSTALDFKPAWF